MSLYISLAATGIKFLPTINSYQSVVLLFFAHKIVLHIRHVCLTTSNSKFLIIYINYFFFSTKSQNSKTYPRIKCPQVHRKCEQNHRRTTTDYTRPTTSLVCGQQHGLEMARISPKYGGGNFTAVGGKRPFTAKRGVEVGATISLTSALHWRWVVIVTPARFSPGKETRYPLNRELGGPQDRCGQVKKIFPRNGIRTPTPSK